MTKCSFYFCNLEYNKGVILGCLKFPSFRKVFICWIFCYLIMWQLEVSHFFGLALLSTEGSLILATRADKQTSILCTLNWTLFKFTTKYKRSNFLTLISLIQRIQSFSNRTTQLVMLGSSSSYQKTRFIIQFSANISFPKNMSYLVCKNVFPWFSEFH
jgi:hypothetical protein